ncbi:PRC-barrel domain containing protein [Dyadobacter psychrotolerans]|uniref:PRC-barrel domain containing protein n=1 Tax=Dyadobacter psychrotolerans TaxID=2541721 RepID=A0A4R5DZU2_9BACT|nr:PRC-barrel domain-containing protein [Dyadobacter psychrotolerans]TDE18100.1 PRC-barrel domain containing protein [Dyadobacter psychrotolerans]
MKRSIKSLVGFTMGAIDGEIGKVKEFYFDDNAWTIRYLIIETGSWLFGRKVLISPQAVLTSDWENKVFLVNLTKEQIKNSPEIDTEKPVSRQQEIELYAHYPWTGYWGGGIWAGGMGTSGMMMSPSLPLETAVHEKLHSEEAINPHLRSTDHVTGYNIKAIDGEVGDVEDFVIDEGTWKLAFMVVDTGNWFPGKKVLISPNWIKDIQWDTSDVMVNASVKQIKDSPEYDANTYLSDGYETNLHTYYGGFISQE